ncbi:Ras-related protein Rab-5A,Ras-related protein RHN1,Ras-related protein Rab-5B,Ras-related protein Rab5,Ras-related protein Rab-5C,Ras-related protein Rab5A,Ras-related protein RABF2b,GTP-binding protein ypt5,Ras-related protein RABF2a [Mytilus coruscus]|uniref:Uncharacterized protein n=1 Tax=Mytilus coruscus TaxID=42192 RepID=A0A6J8BXY7_MYTCO|nr:Ras-related protein Rab-5A,Ras-related protein RHN1,Ras-related protein Rab-5B,Ras-related protein Rab5,Ras-related protein Rab-5C,Ras-related protein Rab5A,Ras-related protein RABF2b,GTP-binding protein ypt5,Ras-related protein RABF2a [Mytilus coruscus]
MACCGSRDKPCYNTTDSLTRSKHNVTSNQLKIVLVGQGGVGKSSITLQYVKGQFNEYIDMTIGAAYFYKTLLVNGKNIKLDIWDTAGQDRFRCVAAMFYRGAVGAIVVYDITDRESFLGAQTWIKQILQNSNNPVQICLEGKSFAEKSGYLFVETSAKTAENIDCLFKQLVRKIVNADGDVPDSHDEDNSIKLT